MTLIEAIHVLQQICEHHGSQRDFTFNQHFDATSGKEFTNEFYLPVGFGPPRYDPDAHFDVEPEGELVAFKLKFIWECELWIKSPSLDVNAYVEMQGDGKLLRLSGLDDSKPELLTILTNLILNGDWRGKKSHHYQYANDEQYAAMVDADDAMRRFAE